MADTQGFFSNPVNRTKTLLYGVLGFIGLGFAWNYHEQIVSFTDDMVHLGIVGASAIAVWWLWSNWGWIIIEKISESITSLFANITPETILRAFVKDMKAQQQVVVNALKEMMAVKNTNEARKKAKLKEMDDIQAKYEVAKENNADEITTTELEERYKRRQLAVDAIDVRLTMATDAISTMTEIRQMTEYHIRDSEDELQNLLEDNESALAMITATSAARKVLGDNPKLDMKLAAVKVIQDRTSRAKAEIDDLMEQTKAARSDQALEKLATQKQGREMLQSAHSRALSARQAQETQGSARMLGAGEVIGNISTTGAAPVWAKRLKGN